MKTIENITIYKCDYCKKTLFRKHAMIHHETYCKSNPNNVRACGACIHLEKTQINYLSKYTDDEGCGIERTTNGFHCNKLNKNLYPLKVLKHNLVQRFPRTFEGQELMPKECDSMERANIDFDSYFD